MRRVRPTPAAKTPVKGMAVNRGELAQLLGVAEITVDAWIRAGCPVVRRASPGRAWRFDSAAVLAWLVNRAKERNQGRGPLDATHERARKDKEMADGLAIRNAVTRGALTPVEQVNRAVVAAFTNARAEVLRLPSKVAASIAAATTTAEAERIITDAVLDCLEQLSSTRVEADDSPAPRGRLPATGCH